MGPVFDLHHRQRAPDHRRRGWLARLSVSGGQEGGRGGSAFDKAVELSEANKHAEAEAAFTDLAAKAPSGYRMLARLRAAAEVASRDPQGGGENV